MSGIVRDAHAVSAHVASSFAESLIDWQRRHGRNELPWQNTRDPYRVWLSEIMLQQTQVITVLGYYGRFLTHFPTVTDLANASEDAVLALWSGLGYYSRARNLHRCAQIVRDEYQGVFPGSKAGLEQLPGIGASTAAAIAAFCFGERVSIFDANVQRVMARMFACDADLSRSAGRRGLQQAAEALLPAARPAGTLPERMVSYTQGLMDLGATVCMPRQAACQRCPVAGLCQARAKGRQQAYPLKTAKLKRTSESWWLLALASCPAGKADASPADAGVKIWLQKRPQPGIWGGLHCLPAFAEDAALQAVIRQLPGVRGSVACQPVRHALTHKDLLLHPVVVQLGAEADLAAILPGAWHGQWRTLGLPAPVRKWLDATFALPQA